MRKSASRCVCQRFPPEKSTVLQILLDAGADTSKKFTDGLTLLHLAAGAGDEEIVKVRTPFDLSIIQH